MHDNLLGVSGSLGDVHVSCSKGKSFEVYRVNLTVRQGKNNLNMEFCRKRVQDTCLEVYVKIIVQYTVNLYFRAVANLINQN